MGGTGSGRWTYHIKKRTVEECWVMGISEIARVVDLSKPRAFSGSLRPIKPATGKRMPPVRWTLRVGDDATPLLRLSYAAEGRPGVDPELEEVIRLQTTQPNFGGARWWFSCPGMVEGKECGRRVGKLYRPPEKRYFTCRLFLDLTYKSCQNRHRYDGLFALMAGEACGETFEAVKQAFSYQAKEARRRRTIPSSNLLDAFERTFGEAKNY